MAYFYKPLLKLDDKDAFHLELFFSSKELNK